MHNNNINIWHAMNSVMLFLYTYTHTDTHTHTCVVVFLRIHPGSCNKSVTSMNCGFWETTKKKNQKKK